MSPGKPRRNKWSFCLMLAAAAAWAAPPKTIISGGRMKLLNKGEAVEFTGGVTLQRGDDFLQADRMTTDKEQESVHAYGNVVLKRLAAAENVRWEARGEEGAYETKKSSGTLWSRRGMARVKRISLDPSRRNQLEMACRSFSFYELSPEGSTGSVTFASAEGEVAVTLNESSPTARKTHIWSNRAAYDGSTGGLRFWNDPALRSSKKFPGRANPKARQLESRDTRELEGSVIVYNAARETVSAEGNAKAVFFSPDMMDEYGPHR